MRISRVLVAVAVVAAGVVAMATPSQAGGAALTFEQEVHHPGTIARGLTGITWRHNDALGSPTAGPYDIYLLPAALYGDTQRLEDERNGTDRRAGVRIGPIAEASVSTGPIEIDGVRYGEGHVVAEFVVPDLPPGEYGVEILLRGCQLRLADTVTTQIVIDEQPIEPVALPRRALVEVVHRA